MIGMESRTLGRNGLTVSTLAIPVQGDRDPPHLQAARRELVGNNWKMIQERMGR